MKLLLDELWPFEIAVQLRRRGFDVIAATEPEHARRYRGIEDELVFEQAQKEGRTIVTDNVADYEPIRLDYESRGLQHYGVVYARRPQFERHQPDALIGLLVRALERFLRIAPPGDEPFNDVHWLSREP